MQAKYCPVCGAKNEYTVKPPKFCGSCSKEMSKAFIVASVPPIVSSAEPIKKTTIHRRPPQDIEIQSDDYFDADEVKARAQELAASVRADITVTSTAGFGIKLGDLFKNPDRFKDIGQRTAGAQSEQPE